MILEHVGLTVSDLERSLRFYTEVLGFSLLRKTTTNAYLYLDDQLLELTQCRVPVEVSPPRSVEECENKLYCGVGITHLGFRVENMDRAVVKIEELGGRLVIPPYELEPQIEYAVEPADEKLKRAATPVGRRYWRIAMFADPDGIILELLER
jgi:catechol 2,3-dioxygenase-like lactoylglutathione lyase family enzyme